MPGQSLSVDNNPPLVRNSDPMWSSTNDKNMDINLLYALGNDLVTSTTTLSVVPSTAGSVAASTQSVAQTLLPTQTDIVTLLSCLAYEFVFQGTMTPRVCV